MSRCPICDGCLSQFDMGKCPHCTPPAQQIDAPIGFNQFVTVARKSKNAEEFISQAREIKGIPMTTSAWFALRYRGNIREAAEAFMREVKNANYNEKDTE